MMRSLALPTSFLLYTVVSAPTFAQTDPSIQDLSFFIGDWRGKSTFLYPRDTDRAPARETVEASCFYILNKTYIQCNTVWTNENGRARAFRLHFNYSNLDEAYQTLFVYDNWPRHVSYLLRPDPENALVLNGELETLSPEGATDRERIEWRISDDKNEIRSVERHHYESDPDGYWPVTFEYTWERVTGSTAR